MELEFGALHIIELPLEENLYQNYKNIIPDHLSSAIDSRKKEFIAGRVCAIEAARKVGFSLENLRVGENREPLWPEEIVGSITHTKKLALALVDKKASCLSIGIDAEELIAERKIETIERMVATKKDLAFLRLFSDKLMAYTVLFSAKEALYKLVHPLCGEFFGFQEAELKALDLDTGEFILKIISDNPKMKEVLGNYRGQFFNSKGHIISIMRLNH